MAKFSSVSSKWYYPHWEGNRKQDNPFCIEIKASKIKQGAKLILANAINMNGETLTIEQPGFRAEKKTYDADDAIVSAVKKYTGKISCKKPELDEPALEIEGKTYESGRDLANDKDAPSNLLWEIATAMLNASELKKGLAENLPLPSDTSTPESDETATEKEETDGHA